MTDPADPTAPADSELPGKADADGWRHLHPLSPLLRGGIALIVIIGIIIANFRDRFVQLFVTENLGAEGRDPGENGDYGGDPIDLIVREGLVLIAIGIALGIIVLIVLFSWISWRFQTYRVSESIVEERSGVLFRKHRRAPLERVQSVNLQRSLFARILGLTKIEVSTAGQGGKVELAYLGYQDAKRVREEILRRARVAARLEAEDEAPASAEAPSLSGRLDERVGDFLDDDVDDAARDARALVRVPVGRLIGSILVGWESVIVLALIVVVLFGSVSGLVAAAFEEDTGAAVFWGGMAVGSAPLIIVFLGLMFSQFNRGFRFTLSRGEESLRIGAGLTSTITESIPFGRVHAIEVRQPLTWRPFGWWKVRITLAGHSLAQGGQSSTTHNLVLPVGSLEDVLRVLETLMPGFADADERVELLDGLVGPGAGYQGAGNRSAWVLWFGKRRAGIQIDDPGGVRTPSEATLRIRRGALNRCLVIMPLVRAQSVVWERPFVHRITGLAAVQAHTVLGPIRVEMRGLEVGVSRRVYAELEAAVLRVQLADARDRAA